MRYIQVFNNTLWGFWFEAAMQENGVVYYRSYQNPKDKAMFLIAKSSITKIMQMIADKLPILDINDIGEAVIDGHLWVIKYCGESVVQQIQGSSGEPNWRYQQIRDIMALIKNAICKDMGSGYMDETKEYNF